MILRILKMCTVDSDIHPLLVSTVENILRLHMKELAEVSEWFDWTHCVPAVNKKISKEAAQMKELKFTDPWSVVVNVKNSYSTIQYQTGQVAHADLDRCIGSRTRPYSRRNPLRASKRPVAIEKLEGVL